MVILNQLSFMRTQMGPPDPLTIQPHIFKWKRGRKTDNTGKGAVLRKAIFLRQHPIAVLQKPLWHVSGFIHNSASNHLQEFISCVCYCFMTLLWLAVAQPWWKLNPLKALPCQVWSHIHCHIRCIVTTETQHSWTCGLIFIFRKLRGWSSS